MLTDVQMSSSIIIQKNSSTQVVLIQVSVAPRIPKIIYPFMSKPLYLFYSCFRLFIWKKLVSLFYYKKMVYSKGERWARMQENWCLYYDLPLIWWLCQVRCLSFFFFPVSKLMILILASFNKVIFTCWTYELCESHAFQQLMKGRGSPPALSISTSSHL